MNNRKKKIVEGINLLESMKDSLINGSIINKNSVYKLIEYFNLENDYLIDFYIPEAIDPSTHGLVRSTIKLCDKSNKSLLIKNRYIIVAKNLLKNIFLFRFLYSQLVRTLKTLKTLNLKNYSIISYSKYKSIINVKDEILLAETFINSGKVNFFDNNIFKEIDFVSYSKTHPEVSIFEINDCIVIGGTNIYFVNDFAIVHDLLNISFDSTSEEMHNRININVKTGKLKLIKNSFISAEINAAAPFLDALSTNYAHWTTEVLPKIVLLCSEKKYENIPIIINEGLHNNILQSLFAVVGPDRPIYELPIGSSLKLKKCIGISVLGYIPFEPRNKSFQNFNHGIFHPAALCDLVKTLELNTSGLDVVNVQKRLYLTRDSSVRVLLNEKVLIRYLSEKGFVAVNLTDLSFLQQLILFKNAEYIISPTGAGLVNCIYCDSNVKIGILLSNHEDMIYGYWQAILSPLNKKISYVSGPVEQREYSGIHADFTIPLSSLEKLIKFWGIS